MPVRLDSALGNGRHALSERGNDLYETPPVAVTALMDNEPLPQVIWEPACGPGKIVKTLRDAGKTVYATDLVDYGCPASHSKRDFLFERHTCFGADAIVTNPPFKLAAQFALRAIEMVPKTCLLLRLAFLEGGNLNTEAGTARRIVLDETPPARVLLFRKRLPMMHRAGWEGKKANSGMAFAWFVWDRAHTGPTELRRISWKEGL